MFTGLVRELAYVKKFHKNLLTLKAHHKAKIGDSIAVNGACLTVIETFSDGFSLELSEESQSNLALENYCNLVHIEPAMTLAARLDGHILQGHIDGIGEIISIQPHKIGTDFLISTQSNTLELCIPKGSIGINGISLTINEVLKDSFRLTLIPHTLQTTLFKTYQVGMRVNIETDIFARILHHFLKNKKTPSLTWEQVDTFLGSY